MLRDITQTMQQENVSMEHAMEKQRENKIGIGFPCGWTGKTQKSGCNENRCGPYPQGEAPVFREKPAMWF